MLFSQMEAGGGGAADGCHSGDYAACAGVVHVRGSVL